MKYLVIITIVLLINSSLCTDQKIVRARLESCPGCSLNRLAQVRSFFYDDVPKYENVEWKKISGAPPIAIFLDEDGEEVERHSLSKFSREECNELLQSKGFVQVKEREL